MGKKKAVKKAGAAGAIDRTPRKEPYNAERLTAVVDRMRDQAAKISGLARAMEDAKVGDIVVDGHAMLLRGLNQVDNFTDNASRAVREARNANRSLER